MRERGRRLGVLAIGASAAALAAASSAGATFPGQNGPIVWQSYTGGPANSNYEIWIMNADGSGKDELTDSEVHDERAQISPDRSLITFMRYAVDGSPSDNSLDIWLMSADGASQVPLTQNDDHEYEPTWSPDGNKIAFSRQTTGIPAGEVAGQDLWRIDANGSNPTNLTNTPIAYECCPEYSPDGTKIVFTMNGHTDGDPNGPYDNNEIWVMDADGTDQQRLTNTASSVQNVGPTWSPDGTKIAWTADGAIMTMNANGSNQTPLTGATGYFAPVWSPDGTRIAATFGLTDIHSIGVADPLTDVVNLTHGNGVQDEYPSWAPAAGSGGAPNTIITREPEDVIAVRRASYRFRAVPPAGATFRCKLDDGNYRACTSPTTYTGLTDGRHTFRVRARNSNGTDPTPASHSFRVRP